jgi:hypothetical protein
MDEIVGDKDDIDRGGQIYIERKKLDIKMSNITRCSSSLLVK